MHIVKSDTGEMGREIALKKNKAQQTELAASVHLGCWPGKGELVYGETSPNRPSPWSVDVLRVLLT